MRLLIAADIFPPESGGPATYAVTLANELWKQGVAVKIVSLNPNSDQSKVQCAVYKVKSHHKFLRYFEYLFLLLKQVTTSDVVYAMGPVNAGLPALVAARLMGKKFVVKVVGDYAWEQGVARWGVADTVDDFQNKNNYSFLVRTLKLVESFVVSKADAVLVPCVYLKNIVVGWGASLEKVAVVYNSLPREKVVPASKKSGEQWLVTAARLVPWKGMAVLINIMSELKSRYPHLKLKIIGDGPERVRLERLIMEKCLTGEVEIWGNLSHEKTLSYISSADLFVLNSGYEGLSHVLLEALSLGRPVLASRAGGNPEIIMSGERSDLFEYNNQEEILAKIIKVLDEDQVNKEKVGGVNALAKFDIDEMVAKTKEILANICAN